MKNIALSIMQDHKIGTLIASDIDKIVKATRQQKGKGTILLSSRQYYVSQLIYPCFEIENKFDDFSQIYDLLSKYPPGKTFRARHTKQEYIILLLEMYLISQVALFDRILHLVNFVFELGLSDAYVKYEIILNNTKVAVDVKKILKKFDKHLLGCGIRKSQNKIKHKERLREDELCHPAAIEQFLRISSPDDMDKYANEDMQFLYGCYVKDRRSRIVDETRTLRKITIEALDQLYPLIHKKYHSYEDA
jgi:hypothetical protein